MSAASDFRPTYLTCAETAKLLRAALKATFPGVRFSVRSHTYAGGASINVGWTDGPFERDVQRVCDLYRGASFDGMTDLKSYHRSLVAFDGDPLPREVHHGADFVFTHRDLSPAYRELLVEAAQSCLDESADWHGCTYDSSAYYEGVACRFGVLSGGLLPRLSALVAPDGTERTEGAA